MTTLECMKYAHDFKRIFGVNLTDYLIPELRAMGIGFINIAKLYNYLLEQNKDYNDEISMETYIRQHYGNKGVNLIVTLISKKK